MLTATIGTSKRQARPGVTSPNATETVTAPLVAQPVSARPTVAANQAPSAPQIPQEAQTSVNVATSTAPLDLLTTHTVRPGDSLSKMAILYYGDKDGFVHIFAANRDVLNRPEQIEVGQVLKIPLVAAYE